MVFSLQSFNSLLPEEMRELITPAFRAVQVFDWLQHKGVSSFDEMTNLPKGLRTRLAEQFMLSTCDIAKKQVSADGTVKYLFRLNDGELIESVVMHYEHGRSICLSTQVGCKMGCTFCASGQHGFQRNLQAGEMLAQIHAAQRDLNITITHIVLMGMGEPLDNYDNTLRFLRLVTHKDGLNIGQRKISLSTCGLVPQIEKLADEKLGITLSVSLHAANNALRSELMPINHKYPLEELLAACQRYIAQTGRRISFEYALLRGINDTTKHAQELADQLRGMLCHVNLIPANDIGRGFAKSKPEDVTTFQAVLEKNKINTTVRRSLGKDIDAACGMLDARHKTLDVRCDLPNADLKSNI